MIPWGTFPNRYRRPGRGEGLVLWFVASLLALLAVLAWGCGVPVVTPLPGPVTGGVSHLRSGAVLYRNPKNLTIPDSLLFAATWVNPVDDGRGLPDSLKLRIVGIQFDSSRVYRPPFPTQASFRQQIPASAYVSVAPGVTGYDVWAEVTTYRRASNAVPVQSAKQRIDLFDTAPPNVTGLILTATKKP
jgi:hypothetical protein